MRGYTRVQSATNTWAFVRYIRLHQQCCDEQALG